MLGLSPTKPTKFCRKVLIEVPLSRGDLLFVGQKVSKKSPEMGLRPVNQ